MPYGVRKTMSSGQKQIMRFSGSPGIISTRDMFRVEFDSVEMAISCVTVSGFSRRVTSGGLGIHDLASNGLFGSSGCQFTNGLNEAGVIELTSYASPGCTGSETPADSTSIILNATVSSAAHVLLTVHNHTGFFNFQFFDAMIPVCDFVNGGVFNNAITAFGSYTTSWGLPTVAMGRNGTATITRICP